MAEPTTKEIIASDEEDTFPGLILGINALFTTCWWIALMFIYVKNHSGDNDMKNRAGTNTFPIAWFWERIVETTDIYVYLSLAMLFGFFAQMIVSFVELIAWIFYLLGGW